MINWIEATSDNIKKHLFKNGEFSDELSMGFAFLTKDKHFICDYCVYYEFGSINYWCYYHDDYIKITHFALRSEYEAILPKEKA